MLRKFRAQAFLIPLFAILSGSSCTLSLNRATYLSVSKPSRIDLDHIPLRLRGGSTLTVYVDIRPGQAAVTTSNFEVSFDGGATYQAPIALDPNETTYDWSVPVVDSSDCLIRLTVADADGKVVVKLSNGFAIDSTAPATPSVTLASSAYTAFHRSTFIVADCTDRDRILINDGTTPTELTPGWTDCTTAAGALTAVTPTPGNYSFYGWAMDDVGNISVASTAMAVTYDIALPTLTLTAPTGGEFFSGGASTSVTWTAADTNFGGTPISVDFSSDGGSSWASVAAAIANSGTQAWTVPSLDVANARIRVIAVDRAGNSRTAISSNFTIDSTNPTVTLTSHTGGQFIEGGSTSAITWAATDTNFGATPIALHFSTDGGSTWSLIAAGLSNSGTYSWTVPAISSSTVRVRVTATDIVGRTSVSASTANFTIDGISPVVSLTAPDGGEVFSGGTSTSITWSATDTNFGATPIALHYSTDGTTWTAIATGLANSGTYSWTVPALNSSSVRVRVTATDASGRVSTDASAANFTIDSMNPTVALTAPLGGQNWRGGATESVTWTATDANFGAAPIALHYSTDGGTSWTPIATGLANSGTYAWTVASVNSASVRVRVTASDASGRSSTSASTSNFLIDSTAPAISLTAPAGGEFLQGGSSLNLTWTASDANFDATPIALHYSTDGGTSWTAIAAAIANSGSYSWTLPSVNSATYRIRATATDRSSNSTTSSSANFTIDSLAPSLTLTSFTGCTVHAPSGVENITWTATDTNFGATPITLEQSTDSGATWSALASGLANSGSYSWTLPAGSSVTRRIRITATDRSGKSTSDSSSYNFAIQTQQNLILGQADATSSSINRGLGVSDETLYDPHAIAITGTRIFAADRGNNRVLRFTSVCQLQRSENADLVLGQPNFASGTANSGGLSASSLSGPTSVGTDGTRLCVADRDNNRVLIWNSLPTSDFAPADVVLGQANFTTDLPNDPVPSAATLHHPSQCLFRGGRLYVVDTDNHRVLIWNSVPASNGASANVVVGQSDFTTVTNYVSSSRLNAPRAVEVVGSRLVVADFGANRVLIWNSIPAANGAVANQVLGQVDFDSFLHPGVTASSLAPFGLATDGTRLAISDSGRARVLIWDSFPVADNEPADRVLGQSNFTSSTPNSGGISSSSLGASVRGLTSDGTFLWISDGGNHRSVRRSW